MRQRRQEFVLACVRLAQLLLARAQIFRRALERLQVAAGLVLPAPGAQRVFARTQQRGNAHRALEQRDIADGPRRGVHAMGVGAAPYEQHDRQVRPGRLLLEQLLQPTRTHGIQRLLGYQDGGRASANLAFQRGPTVTNLDGEVRVPQRPGHQLRVTARGRVDQDALFEVHVTALSSRGIGTPVSTPRKRRSGSPDLDAARW